MKRWEIFCAHPPSMKWSDVHIRIQPILRDLARTTGGYTLLRSNGGWVDDGGKLVIDFGFVVVTWGKEVETAIECAASRLREAFRQDSVVALATQAVNEMHVFPNGVDKK